MAGPLASCGWLLDKNLRMFIKPGHGSRVARPPKKSLTSNYGLTSTKEILMNKKLIALAIAGACVAPAAMAQTANPVTLYGRVYVTLESVEAKSSGTTAAVARRTRVSDQSSLFGVRGTED